MSCLEGQNRLVLNEGISLRRRSGQLRTSAVFVNCAPLRQVESGLHRFRFARGRYFAIDRRFPTDVINSTVKVGMNEHSERPDVPKPCGQIAGLSGLVLRVKVVPLQ